MTSVRESGLVVEVPEAEPAVGAHRQRLDPHARAGVPAHITVLYPFVPAAQVDDLVRSRLAALFGDRSPFGSTLVRIEWFGTDVLWLAPEPDAAFRSLTSDAFAAFPDYPPYRGEHEDPIPHLTVADRADLPDMQQAAAELDRHLPLRFEVRSVSLLAQDADGLWVRDSTYPLGRSVGAAA